MICCRTNSKTDVAHHCSLHFVGKGCEQCDHNHNAPILPLQNPSFFLSLECFSTLQVFFGKRGIKRASGL